MRILYVDDNPIQSEAVRGELASRAPHITVEHVQSSLAAATSLRKQAADDPAFDLVLLAMHRPDGDTPSLLALVRVCCPDTPAVALLDEGVEDVIEPLLQGETCDCVIARDGYLSQLAFVLDAAVLRHQAAVIKEAHDRLAATLNAIPDMLFEVDCAGHIYDFHAPSRDLLYVSPEQFIGKTIHEVLPAGAAQVIQAAIDEAGQQGWQRGATYSLDMAGGPLWFEMSIVTKGQVGAPDAHFVAMVHNITEHVRLVSELERSRSLLEATLESTQDGLLVVDTDIRITRSNSRFATLWGVPQALLDAGDDKPVLAFVQNQVKDPGAFLAQVEYLYAHPEEESSDVLELKDGRVFERFSSPQRVDGVIVGRIWTFHDATVRKRAEAALRSSERLLAESQRIAGVGSWVRDMVSGEVRWSDQTYRIFGLPVGQPLDPYEVISFIHPDDAERARLARVNALEDRAPLDLEYRLICPDGALRHVYERSVPVHDESGALVQLTGIIMDITERKKAEEEINLRLAELEAVNKVSTALRAAQSLDKMLPLLLDSTMSVLDACRSSIWLYDASKDELRVAADRGWVDDSGTPFHRSPLKPGEGIAGYVFATEQPRITKDFHLDPHLSEEGRLRVLPGTGGAAVPIHAGDHVIGTLTVSVRLPRELTASEVRLLTTLSEIAGNAIQRTTLRDQTERRLQHLTALSDIERVITSSFDLRLSLDALVTQVNTQLGVSASAVLLFNASLQTLQYVAGRGFRSNAIERTRLRLGESYAGRAALEGRTIFVADLAQQDDAPRLQRGLRGEDFISYYAVPLLAKGQIKGVLEIFHRAPLEPDEEWLDFLTALAGQCALAIDSVMLYESLQRSNMELILAYDATIEGWSRALDLRDRETEGHTERVVDLTLRLARAMGVTDTELVHVRRGALLHDIGKMGVPDSILLKPGELTDEEWGTMRKHPILAYNLLNAVAYLRPAVDIPYCHHERWDGTGYPRGLRGEQIPLAARLFAIVDVWDALRSDRPYRKAWPEARVIEHIQRLAGTHFDARVVAAFLPLLTGS